MTLLLVNTVKRYLPAAEEEVSNFGCATAFGDRAITNVQAKQSVLHARMLTPLAKLIVKACLGLTVVHYLLVLK